MAKGNSSKILGISFGAEELKLVETDADGKNAKVTTLKDIDSQIPFSIDHITENSGAQLIGTELKKTLTNENVTTKDLAVSLDLCYSTLIKLPYNQKLSGNELNTHLHWELQQYIDEDIDNFVFDSDKLELAPSFKSPELILVGTRKKVITFFTDMARTAGLNLVNVSVDLISAANTFEKNYSFDKEIKTALIELGNQKIVFSLFEGTNLVGYHYLFLDDSVQNDYVTTVNELISMNLKTLFSDHELGTESADFDKIFLYRTNTSHSVQEFIDASSDHEYLMFNPFEKVKLDSELQGDIDFLGDNSEYVEALGLTLR